ncbi:Protein FAM71D, partial [Eurypyga helias]
ILWIGKMNSKFDFKSIISSQASIMGDLQRLLRQGEYDPFTSAPIFESKFVEVKSHSNEIIWHAQDKTACNDYPSFSPPAQQVFLIHLLSLSDSHTIFFERNLYLCLMIYPFFNRLLPLKFVELSVHNTEKYQLVLKLVNGRSYYLELFSPPNKKRRLFYLWLQLISLLKLPENT